MHQQVTQIEDLPNLEDLDRDDQQHRGLSFIPEDKARQVSKVLRSHSTIRQPPGMEENYSPYGGNPHSQSPYSQNPYNQNPHNQNPHNQNSYNQNSYNQNSYNHSPYNQYGHVQSNSPHTYGQVQESYSPEDYSGHRQIEHFNPSGPSCIEIHNHISECPICSKFYKTNNAVFYIVIAILVLIIAILAQRLIYR